MNSSYNLRTISILIYLPIKLMKQFYLVILVMAISLSAFAQTNFQPGYILTLDSSRTDGLIDYRGTNSKAALQVTFKVSETAPEAIYQPTELAGYGLVEGKQFESITVKAADNTSYTYFMEVLAKGAATLYFMKYDDIKERFFVTAADGRVHELIQERRRVDNGNGKVYNATLKHYVGVLTSVLDACAEVKPLINRARLEQSDLIKVVNKYNVCIAPEQVQVARTEDEMKTKVEKMLIVGSTYTNSTFTVKSPVDKYAMEGNISPSVDLTAGIALNITASKLSQKLSLYMGLMYQQYKVEGEYRKNFAGGSYYNYDFFFEASHIKMPMLIRYTWPKGKIRPFINAGAQAGILLHADSHVNRYGKFGSRETNYEHDMVIGYRETEVGFIGGLGIKTEAFKGKKVTLELRHERNNGQSPVINYKQINNISSVLIGVSF